MYKELGRLSQGYKEKGTGEYIKRTSTVLFMNLDKLKTTYRDQVVTYAQIVVYYRPQKKGPNLCENNCKGGLLK